MTEAIVLAGGDGSRLRPLTDDIPKGLVHVKGKPLLEHILLWLSKNSIERVILATAYKREKIIETFQDSFNGMSLDYSEHTVEGGTGEALAVAMRKLDPNDYFFAVNGDQITDLPLERLMTHEIACCAVGHPRLPFGTVKLRGHHAVRFEEKPLSSEWCSMGIYHFRKAVTQYLPRRGDIENTVLPRLARAGKLRAIPHYGKFFTVNTLKDLEEAELNLK